jgi:hypothetical protein
MHSVPIRRASSLGISPPIKLYLIDTLGQWAKWCLGSSGALDNDELRVIPARELGLPAG